MCPLSLIKNINTIYRFYNFELNWFANCNWLYFINDSFLDFCILAQTMFILNADEPTFNVVGVVFIFASFNLLQRYKWICAKIKQSLLDKLLLMSTTKDMESTFSFLWGADKPIYFSMHDHIWLVRIYYSHFASFLRQSSALRPIFGSRVTTHQMKSTAWVFTHRHTHGWFKNTQTVSFSIPSCSLSAFF